MAFLLDNKLLSSIWWDNPVVSYIDLLTIPEKIITVLILVSLLVTNFYILRWHDGCEDPNTKQKGTSWSGIYAGLTCAFATTAIVITTFHNYNWNIAPIAANVATQAGQVVQTVTPYAASITNAATNVVQKAASAAKSAATVANRAALAGFRSAASTATNLAGPI